MSLAGSLIWMLPVMTPPPVESAGLYSPPPVRKLSCCPAAAGGTRPLVPADDAVAPSYSGTEIMHSPPVPSARAFERDILIPSPI